MVGDERAHDDDDDDDDSSAGDLVFLHVFLLLVYLK